MDCHRQRRHIVDLGITALRSTRDKPTAVRCIGFEPAGLVASWFEIRSPEGAPSRSVDALGCGATLGERRMAERRERRHTVGLRGSAFHQWSTHRREGEHRLWHVELHEIHRRR
jgi:hypothetical protein